MSQRGLTLVELILTISLATILAIPTALLLGAHLQEAMSSHDSTMALQLGRFELERLDSLNNFFASPDLTIGSTVLTNFQGYPYDVTRAVTCQVGDCTSTASSSQGVKRITITVTPTGSAVPLAKLITYRTKCVCFGSNPPLSQINCSNVCS